MQKRVQVVIVVLILIVGGGLVLTFISRVRDESARARCRNNLRRIGIGLHNYHSIYGRFPTGTLPNKNLPPEKRLSWLVETWNNIGGIGLFVDEKKAWDAEENLDPKGRDMSGPVVISCTVSVFASSRRDG